MISARAILMNNAPSHSPESPTSNAVRPDVLELLRCPVTRSPLRQEGDWLIAEVGGLRYPVRDGIPVMLPEEAQLPAGVASLDDFRARFGYSNR
jgi:uncharacterized protein YbaR (Trm112 family)